MGRVPGCQRASFFFQNKLKGFGANKKTSKQANNHTDFEITIQTHTHTHLILLTQTHEVLDAQLQKSNRQKNKHFQNEVVSLRINDGNPF